MILLLFALGCGIFGSEPPFEEYTVRKGDTLGRIAKAQGVTVEDLRAWNGLSGDLIEIGQVLKIQKAPEGGVPVAEVAPKKPRKPRSGGTVRSAPIRAPEAGAESGGKPVLKMPPAKACLAGPTEVAAEEGFAASEGLSLDQVRDAMSGFVGNTLPCFGDAPSGTVTLSITVGCDGRVSAVETEDDGGVAQGVISCVADTLRYAPFPPHDIPDGFTFGYPLRYEAAP